ncbi:PspC domain-containing protein [Lacticaseibacillus porcinae]|uniref:PspC domain-containing protein n=1 Tax=Lacticaseibacillus porcinae TaxID=1123687 RepID=UPI000F79F70D|nr:PspC domain-containing protein [Lacticaseibacillus porcinae]
MAGNQYRKLRRSRTNSVMGGVCGGLGEFFGIDPVIFRIIFAVAFFVYGTGFGLYLILWLVIPQATRSEPHFEEEEAPHDEDDHHDDDEWSDF